MYSVPRNHQYSTQDKPLCYSWQYSFYIRSLSTAGIDIMQKSKHDWPVPNIDYSSLQVIICF